jgi:DNA polymerase III delta subunit
LEIKSNTCKLIIESCDGSQWEILHELENLSRITKVITDDVVKKYLQPNLDADVFNVLQLALNRDTKQLNMALDTLSRKEDINKFFGLLSSQVFTLTAIKNSLNQKGSASDLNIAPFLLIKQRDLADKITDIQLANLLKRLAEIDGQIKLGKNGWLLVKVAFNQIFD